MAFLSLGLHNDEPTSSDQGKNKSPRADEKARSSAPLSLGLASTDQNASTVSSNAIALPRFAALAGPNNGKGASHPENGNGHSVAPFDGFDADKFEDEADSSQTAEQLHAWMSAALHKSTESGNGNGSRAVAPATKSAKLSQEPPQPTAALPPSVELLRRKLAEEEKRRALRRAPAPLTASVDGLSSSERQWVPTFATFASGYVPGKGLLYSIISHEVVLFGLFLLVTRLLPMLQPSRLIAQDNPQDRVIFLPELGGGSEGEKSPGAGESAPQEPAAAPARATKGFAYPGRAQILSDPPNPTNTFQTIMRPLLVHPEPIKKLVPAPNIVQMAETRLPSDLVAPKPAMPQLKEVPKPIRVKQDSLSHRDAKFDVPVNAPKLVAKADMPKLPAAEQPLPEAPKVEPQPKREEEKQEVETPAPTPIKVSSEKRTEKPQKETAPPSPAQIARMEMHGKAKEPLLSVSPMPLPDGPNAKVPNGEALGKFAIAPGGTLNPTSITPGKANGAPSVTPGTGQENAKAPNAAGSDVASESGSANGKGTSGAGGPGHATIASGTGTSGTGGGTGATAGTGTGGPGSGKGHGATGKGAGASGGKQGSGSGTGAGSGSGTGAFPGITIQGGEDEQANAKDKPAFTIEPQTSYGMTIVSTASSGGGLEDFGVFRDERIFTVYIPVKPSPELADPTWTMQYAVVKDESVSDAGSQQVVPPSVATSEWPHLSSAIEKKYAQHQVVIYAMVGKDGKVSGVSVKRTPDPRVSDPIAAALKKWVFHPALVNNQPVSVKILLGIPLT
jgi:hypothetical protein